jgi:hypothetical protein
MQSRFSKVEPEPEPEREWWIDGQVSSKRKHNKPQSLMVEGRRQRVDGW